MTTELKNNLSTGQYRSRRNFLKVSVGAAAIAGSTASLILPKNAFAQGTGLVALVHTQAAGDNGPIDSMIASLKKLSEEKGFPIRTIYAQDSATFPAIFSSLAEAGAEVIAGTFNEVAEPIKELAPKYPNTKWIQIFGDPFEPAMPNVSTVSYDYYLGCYLSGLFASKVSKTGKIGYIGGVSLPPLNADLNAMKAAAAAVGADKTVTGAFAGSFQDPAKGQEIATQMYQDGIDYIQTDSAATDTGIIQAANEGEGRMVSAISPEQYKLDPGCPSPADIAGRHTLIVNRDSALIRANDSCGNTGKSSLPGAVLPYHGMDHSRSEADRYICQRCDFSVVYGDVAAF